MIGSIHLDHYWRGRQTVSVIGVNDQAIDAQFSKTGVTTAVAVITLGL